MPGTVVVVTGASPITEVGLAAVPEGATLVAADGGFDHARAAGLTVDRAVGDFDSIAAQPDDVPLERHPAAKDATDLELALDAALALAPEHLLVLSGAGGRLDHLLVELALISAPKLAAVEVDAVFDSARVHVVRTERRLTGRVGELVSLVAMHGPAKGVTTEGLRYSLQGETLEAGTSRGASNVFAEPDARIELESGVLLALRPG